MVIRLRAHSPLWMGGHAKPNRQVKESGIIGCLRFWDEGVERGRGTLVSIPGQEENAHQCPVCTLFGYTGWARRFRLRISGLKPLEKLSAAQQKEASLRAGGGNFRSSGPWSAFWCEDLFEIDIEGRSGADSGTELQVAELVAGAARWGGLGAKTQFGFGQVEVIEPSNLRAPALGNHCGEEGIFTASTECFRSWTYRASGATGEPWDAREAIRDRLRALWGEQNAFLGYVVKHNGAAGSRIHVTNVLPGSGGEPNWLKVWFDASPKYTPDKVERCVAEVLNGMGFKERQSNTEVR